MRRTWSRWAPVAVIVLLLAVTVVGLASADPAPRDRTTALEQRLRCPVCKTVSIAESPSETASEMRRIVARQVAAGRTDQQIITYFQDRYGEWVLQDPPPRGRTLLLWVLPALAAAGGAVVLGVRARSSPPEPRALSEADRDEVSAAVTRFRTTHHEDDEP